MKRPTWLTKYVIAPFINSDRPAVVASLVLAVVVMLLFPDYVRNKYLAIYSGIPATFLALMGFVLTAAAIVASVQDKGMIRLYKKHKPRAWNMTKRVFLCTARLFGIFAVGIFILGTTPLTQTHTGYNVVVERGFLGIVVAVCVLSAFQLNKMIYVLGKLMDAAQGEEEAAQLERALKTRDTPD